MTERSKHRCFFSKSMGENDEVHRYPLKAVIGRSFRNLSIFLFAKFIPWVVGELHYEPRPASFNHVHPLPPFFRLPFGPLFLRVRQRRTFLISGERLRRLEGTRRPRGLSRNEGRKEIERGETIFFVRSQLQSRSNSHVDNVCKSSP